MNAFSAAVEVWHDYYMMVGTASATLVGLLFVGLSLNMELLRRPESADLRTLAALTFNCFIYVLMFAIVFLIPNQGPQGLGLPLLGMGAAGLGSTILEYVRSRESRRSWGRSVVARRFAVPLLSFAGVIPVGVGVLQGDVGFVYWLIPVTILLLGNASRNAWDLLFGERAR